MSIFSNSCLLQSLRIWTHLVNNTTNVGILKGGWGMNEAGYVNPNAQPRLMTMIVIATQRIDAVLDAYPYSGQMLWETKSEAG